MKTVLTILAALFAFSANAQAHHHSKGYNSHKQQTHTYVSGYSSCGCPIYTKRVIIGYNCQGYPTYRYHSVPSSCSCRRSNTHSNYQYKGNSKYHAKNKNYTRRYTPSCRSSYSPRRVFRTPTNRCISTSRYYKR